MSEKNENLNEMEIDKVIKKEKQLGERLQHLQELEKQIKDKEKIIKNKEKAKKQVLLRLAPTLWEEIASLAEDDFRSINGEIEYLLNEAVKKRRK